MQGAVAGQLVFSKQQQNLADLMTLNKAMHCLLVKNYIADGTISCDT